MKQGLKDNHVRDLTNSIRDHLKETFPPLKDFGCLRGVVSVAVNNYLHQHDLLIDSGVKQYRKENEQENKNA